MLVLLCLLFVGVFGEDEWHLLYAADDLDCTGEVSSVLYSFDAPTCVVESCAGTGSETVCNRPWQLDAEIFYRAELFEYPNCTVTFGDFYASDRELCTSMGPGMYFRNVAVGDGSTLETYTYGDDLCTITETLVATLEDGVCSLNVLSPMNDGMIYYYEPPVDNYMMVYAPDDPTCVGNVAAIMRQEQPTCTPMTCTDGMEVACIQPAVLDEGRWLHSELFYDDVCAQPYGDWWTPAAEICTSMDFVTSFIAIEVGTTVELYSYNDTFCSVSETLIDTLENGVCSDNILSPTEGDTLIYRYVDAGVGIVSFAVAVVLALGFFWM